MEDDKPLRVGALSSRRILHAPVSGNRLAWPHGTGLTGSLVTHREHEVELRCTGTCELIPALAAKALCWELKPFEKLQGEWIDLPLGKAAGAEAHKSTATPFVDEDFTHDAARGVSGAEKENVVGTWVHGLTIKMAVDGHKRLN